MILNSPWQAGGGTPDAGGASVFCVFPIWSGTQRIPPPGASSQYMSEEGASHRPFFGLQTVPWVQTA